MSGAMEFQPLRTPISSAKKTTLAGNRATLTKWLQQHRAENITGCEAAFTAAIAVIGKVGSLESLV